jgi:hypothetical protein
VGATRIAALLALCVLAGCSGCGGDSADEQASLGYEWVESAVATLAIRFPEATDTAVRHDVLVAVYCSVVHDEPVPDDFAMFSPEGDRAVRSHVRAFVSQARAATAGRSEEERIEAVWGDDWGENVFVQPSDCERR